MSTATNIHEGVYIIDCIWEFFVLVGSKARGHGQDIRLGLVVASVRLDIFTHMPILKLHANINDAENVQEISTQQAIPTDSACSCLTVAGAVGSAPEFSQP